MKSNKKCVKCKEADAEQKSNYCVKCRPRPSKLSERGGGTGGGGGFSSKMRFYLNR